MPKEIYLTVGTILIIVYFGIYGALLQISNTHLSQWEIFLKLIGIN